MTREEAIRRIKAWNLDSDDMEVLTVVIPELRESEDERIRKQLIDAIKIGRSNSGISFTEEAASRYIAWLEKQKEQKVDIDKLRRDLYQSGYNDGYQHGKEDAQKEQKPAEWSGEDEDMLNSCISSIEEAKENRYAYKETDGDTSYDHEIAWLKSLRPQPKQEWSEEDEDFINMLILHFNYLIDKGGDSVETYKSYIEKLKSLRPSWKPSKEQMKALEDAFRKDGSDEYRKTINSLYQQLKKL